MARTTRRSTQLIGERTSLLLRILHQQHGVSCYQLVKRFGNKYSGRSVYRHAKKPLDADEQATDRRRFNKGRPRKLSLKEERIIIRTLKILREEAHEFSSKKIQDRAGLRREISNRDIRRCLGKHGYKYCQSRKKGLLNERDKRQRLSFARHYSKVPDEYWETDVSFYLDGVGFAYKSNPSCK